MNSRIEVLYKVYCLKIFLAAVLIRRPLAVFFAVVEIKHRRKRTYTHTVNMEFFNPEHCRRNKKADYLAF